MSESRTQSASGSIYHLLHSVREKWSAVCKRYERAGSDWHLKMPGDWPTEVVMTMDELRSLAAVTASSETKESEWFDFDKAKPAPKQRVRVRLFSGTETDAVYFDGDFQSECMSVTQWLTGSKVYRWRANP